MKKKAKRFVAQRDGQPFFISDYIQFCDCGLVHNVKWRIVHKPKGIYVELTMRRNNLQTRLARQKSKVKQ